MGRYGELFYLALAFFVVSDLLLSSLIAFTGVNFPSRLFMYSVFCFILLGVLAYRPTISSLRAIYKIDILLFLFVCLVVAVFLRVVNVVSIEKLILFIYLVI